MNIYLFIHNIHPIRLICSISKRGRWFMLFDLIRPIHFYSPNSLWFAWFALRIFPIQACLKQTRETRVMLKNATLKICNLIKEQQTYKVVLFCSWLISNNGNYYIYIQQLEEQQQEQQKVWKTNINMHKMLCYLGQLYLYPICNNKQLLHNLFEEEEGENKNNKCLKNNITIAKLFLTV